MLIIKTVKETMVYNKKRRAYRKRISDEEKKYKITAPAVKYTDRVWTHRVPIDVVDNREGTISQEEFSAILGREVDLDED